MTVPDKRLRGAPDQIVAGQLRQQDENGSGVEQQIEDIQRPYERPLRKHADLFKEVWLRAEGSQTEEQSYRHQGGIGQRIKPSEHG